MRRLQALSRPRAECMRCGAGCYAYQLGPLRPADLELVRGALPAVRGAFPDQPGTDEPFEVVPRPRGGGEAHFLRKREGACVFFRPGVGCTVHAAAGSEHKPLVCRLYPLQLVQTEGGLRIGMRPTCLNDVGAFADGPPVDAEQIDAMLGEAFEAAQRDKPDGEDAVLGFALRPGWTGGVLLGLLAGRDEEPPGFEAWAERAVQALLAEADAVLAQAGPDDELGPLHPASPTGVRFRAFRGWLEAREAPGAWPEPPGPWLAYFRDVVRRQVFLRETARFPTLPWALTAYCLVARWAAGWARAVEDEDPPALRFGRMHAVLLQQLESPRLQRAVLAIGPPFA